MSKPYFLLATGAFAPPFTYDGVVEGVSKHGYEMKAIHLETVGLAPGKGRDTPAATMYDDAKLIAKEVEKLADEGREVILVAHSYGAMPATESTKGLSIQERQKAGKSGGIVRLAYMTVVLPSVGKSALDLIGSLPLEIDDDGWVHPVEPELAVQMYFSDMPREEALREIAGCAWHSYLSFTNPLTHAGYKDIPVSYLLCEDDKIVTPAIQKSEIETIERESGQKVDVTSIKASHSAHASAPDKVINWLIDVASKIP